MKKFLSALIILAMALTLSLSLASCNTNEAVGTNTVQAETKAFTDPPAMDEIKDIIYNVFGYEAFDAPLYSDRDDSLIGLYSTNYERYIAYIMVDNDYGEYTYALVLYDAMGIEIDRYFLNSADGGVDQNRLDHACRRAGNFVGTHYNTEDHTATFLRELIVYICQDENITLHNYFPRENGVTVVSHCRDANLYMTYIDTFGGCATNTGVRAIVGVREDMSIFFFYLVNHNLTNDLASYPATAEVEDYFYSYVDRNKDSVQKMPPLPNFDHVCSEFNEAVDYSFDAIRYMNANDIERLIYSIFGTEMDAKTVIAILAVVLIVIILSLIIAIIVIPATVLAIIIITVAVIITVRAAKKKKRKALSKKTKAETDIPESTAE